MPSFRKKIDPLERTHHFPEKFITQPLRFVVIIIDSFFKFGLSYFEE